MNLFGKEPQKTSSKEIENIKRLFYSGCSKSQEIALSQCANYDIKVNKLVLDYLVKDWNKNKVIEKVGLDYAEGAYGATGYVEWFKFPSLLDVELCIKDDTDDMITLESPFSTFLLYKWNQDIDIDGAYSVVRKKLTIVILNNWKELFSHLDKI